MSRPERPSNDDLSFLYIVGGQISGNYFTKARQVLNQGLERLKETDATIDPGELAIYLEGFFNLLFLAVEGAPELFSRFRKEMDIERANARCSFCLKKPEEVEKFLSGSEGYICNVCVDRIFHEFNQ